MKEVHLEEREVCFCFEELLNELQKDNSQYIYISAPPGSGKTTLLLEWAKKQKNDFIFIEFEPGDKEPYYLLKSFGKILSSKSQEFKEYYENIKDFSVRPFFTGFKDALKRCSFPSYTYLFLNIANLEEKTEEIFNNYIIPLWKEIQEAKIVVKGHEDNPEYIPDYFKKYTSKYFKIDEAKFKILCKFYGIELSPNEVMRLIDKTNGWILPIIMVLNKLKQGSELLELLDKKQIFRELFLENINKLSENDRRILYAISQFIKFDGNLLAELLEIKNFEELIKKWERKGIYIEKKRDNGNLIFSLNPIFKDVIDEYIFRLKGGEILYFLIHSKAAEYFSHKEDYPSAAYHSLKALKYEDVAKYLFYAIFDLIDKDKFIFLENIFKETGESKIREIPSFSLLYAIYLCSRKRYEEAYKILNEIGNKLFGREKLTWFYYYGLASMYSKNEKESENIVQSGIEVLEKFPVEYLKKEYEKKWYIRLKASFYNLRGLLNLKFMKFKEAEYDFKKAIHLFEEIGNIRAVNILKNNLVRIFLETGTIKKCEEIIKELISSKGPWERLAYLNTSLLELVYRENIDKAEEYLEKYLNLSRKYEILTGWFYYYSIRFTIEAIYKKDIEKAKEILDKFETFLKDNYIYSWENALFTHKIEFCFLNSNLEDINDYMRLLNSRRINEDVKMFLTCYASLYSYLMRQHRESIFRKLEDMEKASRILSYMYLTKFCSLILEDFNDENKNIMKEKYLNYQKKYAFKE